MCIACQTAPSPHTSPVGATQTGFSLIALRYRVAVRHPHCRLHLWRRSKPVRRAGIRIPTETDLDTRNQCMMMNVGSMYMYLMAHLGIPEHRTEAMNSGALT